MALREKNTNPSSSREKAPTIADAALLGFISSLGPFAVNANVPGFHAMAADMGVSFIAVQLLRPPSKSFTFGALCRV